MQLFFRTTATARAGQSAGRGRGGGRQNQLESIAMNESNKRLCVSCFWRMDGVCYWKKRIVGDAETCLRFTPRQDAPLAPEPEPEPLPAVKLLESSPEPSAVAAEFLDPPNPVAKLRRLRAVSSRSQPPTRKEH